MPRRYKWDSERSALGFVLWVGAGAFVLGVLLLALGLAIHVTGVAAAGVLLAVVGMFPAMLLARIKLGTGGHRRTPMDHLLSHEEQEWDEVRRRRTARAKSRMRRDLEERDDAP
jgi:hypothetical protein